MGRLDLPGSGAGAIHFAPPGASRASCRRSKGDRRKKVRGWKPPGGNGQTDGPPALQRALDEFRGRQQPEPGQDNSGAPGRSRYVRSDRRREPFAADEGFITQVPQTNDPLTTDGARMLLERARAGDGEAFCRLAAAHEQRLYRQAVALCGRLDTAEDLAAETLVEAWRSLSRYDGTCRFSTWLYGILLHRHLKLVRRARSRPVPLSSLPRAESEGREDFLSRLPDPAPDALAALEQYERAASLRAAVAGLPDGHRTVLLMRFFEGASVAEIAAALAIPPGTVKSRLHHALARLRERGDVVNLFEKGRDS